MWRSVENDPPKMEYFADPEEAAINKAGGTVKGLVVDVLISYNEKPDAFSLDAEAYIDFDNHIYGWETRGEGKTISLNTPKWWREK